MAGGLDTRGVDPAIDVQLCHARLDVCACPGVPRLGRPHAPAQQLDLIRILAAAHRGQGVNQLCGIGIADTIVDAQAGAARVHALQRGQLPRTAGGGLPVVPVNDLARINMRLFGRFGHPVVVDEGRVPVVPEQQEAAKPCSQAERIDAKVGQIDQVHPIAQPQMIALRLGIQLLPQSQPALPASFGAQHLLLQPRPWRGTSRDMALAILAFSQGLAK